MTFGPEITMAATCERDGLLSLLFEGGEKLMNIRCFPVGTPAKDDLCKELRSAISQKRNGTATVSAKFNDTAPKIDVRAWIANLNV